MDSQQQHNGTRRQRARRGVSLIEILVVLVILVTGILTIIRLFPSGFFSIQSTGNAALADGLGAAAIDLGAQSASGLPEAILPDNLNPLINDTLAGAMTTSAAYSNYDPDNPNNLENARAVINETVAVPTAVNGQSVYVVKYGPVLMPADTTQTAAQLPLYFTVNSPNWSALSGNSAPAALAQGGILPPVDIPQDTLVPGQEKFLVDLANRKIAVPYAPYTLTTAGTAMTTPIYTSYHQRVVVVITGDDGKTYTQFLDVPAATIQDSTNPQAPKDTNNPQGYLPDNSSSYQGGWFDPTQSNTITLASGSTTTFDYIDSLAPTPQHQPVLSNVKWVSVALYRPYTGLATPTTTAASSFGLDPYQFELTSANIVTTPASGSVPATGSNPGAISFNPKAAVGSGAQARQVKISYVVFSWGVLREDHDIPALTGTGSTFVVRTTVPNLKLAGSANPDNSINPGLAGSSNSIVIMDLDSGKIIAPLPTNSPYYDPTNDPDSPLNNEDLNGTKTGPISAVAGSPSYTNISYSLGRLTFGSNAFGDNTKSDGSGNAPAHRIRIFYTADLDWTVAVQKPAAYFQELVTMPAQSATGTTALAAYQYAYDRANTFVYFARCNAGKTVEIDGSYTLSGTTQGFSDTVAVDPTLFSNGDTALRVNLNDVTKFAHPVPTGAVVTFNAVRGLSARSVVAWKERNQYKVHSVDAVLNGTP